MKELLSTSLSVWLSVTRSRHRPQSPGLGEPWNSSGKKWWNTPRGTMLSWSSATPGKLSIKQASMWYFNTLKVKCAFNTPLAQYTCIPILNASTDFACKPFLIIFVKPWGWQTSMKVVFTFHFDDDVAWPLLNIIFDYPTVWIMSKFCVVKSI